MFLAAKPCNIKTQRYHWLEAITFSQACGKQYTESDNQVLEQQDVNVTQKKSFAPDVKENPRP